MTHRLALVAGLSLAVMDVIIRGPLLSYVRPLFLLRNHAGLTVLIA
jgi:hypothetical protein